MEHIISTTQTTASGMLLSATHTTPGEKYSHTIPRIFTIKVLLEVSFISVYIPHIFVAVKRKYFYFCLYPSHIRSCKEKIIFDSS